MEWQTQAVVPISEKGHLRTESEYHTRSEGAPGERRVTSLGTLELSLLDLVLVSLSFESRASGGDD